MRLATVKADQRETAAIWIGNSVFPVVGVNKELGTGFPTAILEIIRSGRLEEMKEWYKNGGEKVLLSLEKSAIPADQALFGPLYRRPRKIWGIGLNYREHAADLSEKAPNTEPASFMKPDTAIIGSGDTVKIPLQSERTTAEGELGVIIGKECKNISETNAGEYIAGYTTVLDMTAEDILQKNPRYLTRSKSFDTFFSFGPVLVTPDELPEVAGLKVATVLNGEVHRENTVANMTFPPFYLVSFHSRVMTLLPGDIISTGTPGAAVIKAGDTVECHIDGFHRLSNPVTDLKTGNHKIG